MKSTYLYNTFEEFHYVNFPISIHLLRLSLSSFPAKKDLEFPYQKTWETSIENLPEWKLDNLTGSVKRNVRKAKRMDVKIIASQINHHKKIYDLYSQTVKRHEGNLRYTEKYFKELIALSQKRRDLYCLSAIFDEEIISFIVVGMEGERAYYSRFKSSSFRSGHSEREITTLFIL